MEEKAASHNAMMQRFHLRKMSTELDFPTAFGRANEVVIDKAIGSKPHWTRRFSLRRFIRSVTGTKARQQAWQTLLSPITPKSWPSTLHGILMLAVYHTQLLYLPFSASYYPDGSPGTSRVMILLETIFLFDLLLNLNTSYVENGVLVSSRGKIVRKYLANWFAFDLLSAFPIQAINWATTGSGSHTNSIARGVQCTLMILRLLRVTFLERGVLLSRVMRVANHLAEWVRYSRYSHLLGIAQLMWLVLLIAHYMACLWHVIAKDHARSLGASVGEQYAADYYYAVSLIQGQGSPVGTWAENTFSSVAIIVGSVILAIVFGNIALLVSNFNANETNYHRKMEAVYATMSKMELPLKLRERVKEYYTHVWLEYEALDGNIHKFRDELTHTLGIEIGLYKHMNLVVKVPFWEDCTPDFLTQIVLNLELRVYMPDDYVTRRREIGSEMMMINRGYCKLSKPCKAVLASKAANGDVANAHTPLLSPQDFIDAAKADADELSGSEGDSDEVSSDDELHALFGVGMFGASMSSRRMSAQAAIPQLDVNPSDFTDVERFRHVHPRRPSYPNGVEAKKSRRYREYLRPGQAFGEMSLLMNYKRTANIRALTFVEMGVLSRKAFQEIIARYPEDRRRVLTKMLESCIEKKVIPFPWEKIIEAVSTKRRNSGNTNISRASVIATMTAAEATAILVEAIDVNVPDESIRYGFQSFDQEFVEDSSLPHANSTDAKISNTLQRRNSVRAGQSFSRRNSRADSNEGSASTGEVTETESEASLPSAGDAKPDKSLKKVLLILQSMATNIEQLQQDVNELKGREHGCRGCRCGGGGSSPASVQRVASAPSDSGPSASSTRSPHAVQPLGSSRTTHTKEDQPAQVSRKPSLVAIPLEPSSLASLGSSRHSSREKHPTTKLRKVRSSTQDSREHEGSASSRAQTRRVNPVVGPIRSPGGESYSERYPATLSSRSRAARNQTLADMLWNRSNTSGDLLKHTEEERHASRIRRQIATRHSMPTEMVAEQASPRETDTEDHLRSNAAEEDPRQYVPGHPGPSVWDDSASPTSIDKPLDADE